MCDSVDDQDETDFMLVCLHLSSLAGSRDDHYDDQDDNRRRR